MLAKGWGWNCRIIKNWIMIWVGMSWKAHWATKVVRGMKRLAGTGFLSVWVQVEPLELLKLLSLPASHLPKEKWKERREKRKLKKQEAKEAGFLFGNVWNCCIGVDGAMTCDDYWVGNPLSGCKGTKKRKRIAQQRVRRWWRGYHGRWEGRMSWKIGCCLGDKVWRARQ